MKKDSEARADANYNNSPAGIRARAEKAGFNPLAFIGPGTGTGAQYAPTMGSSMARVGQMLADAGSNYEQLQIQNSQLEMEAERLRQIAEDTKLRASAKASVFDDKRKRQAAQAAVPGMGASGRLVYVAPTISSPLPPPRPTPSAPSYLEKNGFTATDQLPQSGFQSSNDDPAIGSSGPVVAKGRNVQVDPVVSMPGLMEIQNDWTGGPIILPGSDGDILDLGQWPTLLFLGGPQVLGNAVFNKAEQVYTDRRFRQMYGDVYKAKEKAKKYRKVLPRSSRSDPARSVKTYLKEFPK
jgi:hypothetical protein